MRASVDFGTLHRWPHNQLSTVSVHDCALDARAARYLCRKQQERGWTVAADERRPEGEDGQDSLTTGDMARLSQTTLRTVRFYEAEGLIQAMERGDGDHRRFARGELHKLQIISDLRESGLSLKQIKDLIGKEFAKYGLLLVDFYITSITPPDEVQKAIDTCW